MVKKINYTICNVQHTISYETSTIPDNMMNGNSFITQMDFTNLLHLLRVWVYHAKKNNITYWAVDGTLLGCVRHKGIIPWDNDIDLCIKYQEYDKIYATDFGEFEVVKQIPGLIFRKKGTITPFIYLFVYGTDCVNPDYISNCFPIHPITKKKTYIGKIGNIMEFAKDDIINMKTMLFENINIPIPHNAVNVLHKVYGSNAITHLYYDNHVENHSNIIIYNMYRAIPINGLIAMNYVLGLSNDTNPTICLDTITAKCMKEIFFHHHDFGPNDIKSTTKNIFNFMKPFITDRLPK